MDIRVGQEALLDYGSKYWDKQGTVVAGMLDVCLSLTGGISACTYLPSYCSFQPWPSATNSHYSQCTVKTAPFVQMALLQRRYCDAQKQVEALANASLNSVRALLNVRQHLCSAVEAPALCYAFPKPCSSATTLDLLHRSSGMMAMCPGRPRRDQHRYKFGAVQG